MKTIFGKPVRDLGSARIVSVEEGQRLLAKAYGNAWRSNKSAIQFFESQKAFREYCTQLHSGKRKSAC